MKNQAKCGSCRNASLNSANPDKANPDKANLTKGDSGKGDSGKGDSTKANFGHAEAGKANAEYVWKQLEDVVVPRLRLSVSERAVYFHLLRHSRLEGKLRYRFSIASLGRGTRLSATGIRAAMRRLVHQGALRLVQRSKAGHVVEVRVPDEIRVSRADVARRGERARHGRQACTGGQGRLGGQVQGPDGAGIEEIDFTQTKALRQSIHEREGGRCFYCMRRLATGIRCVDHVVAQARSGRNWYRNLVSACLECNSQKGEKRAEDFLRWLYRERRLTAVELNGRVRALKALAAGQMRPDLQRQGT